MSLTGIMITIQNNTRLLREFMKKRLPSFKQNPSNKIPDEDIKKAIKILKEAEEKAKIKALNHSQHNIEDMVLWSYHGCEKCSKIIEDTIKARKIT